MPADSWGESLRVLEREIYLVANPLIDRFGDEAGVRAALQADAPNAGTRRH